MPDIPFYTGRYYSIVYASIGQGVAPARLFFNELGDKERGRLRAVIVRLADSDDGQIRNREKFRLVQDGIYEFKDYQRRMFCFLHSNQRVVLLCGVIKKKDKHRPSDIQRAKDIRSDYLQGD